MYCQVTAREMRGRVEALVAEHDDGGAEKGQDLLAVVGGFELQ